MSFSLCQLDVAKNLTGDRGILRHVQTFVRFCDDMVDDSFHVLRPFPDSKLPIRASAFAHDQRIRSLPAACNSLRTRKGSRMHRECRCGENARTLSVDNPSSPCPDPPRTASSRRAHKCGAENSAPGSSRGWRPRDLEYQHE